MNKRALLVAVTVVSCGAAPVAPPTSISISTSTSTSTPTPTSTSTPTLDRAFLRAYTETRRFRLGRPSEPTLTADGRVALFLRSGPRDPRQSLFETDLTTGATREVLSPDTIAAGPEALTQEERARRERMRTVTRGFTSFDLSRDGKTVIVALSGKLVALDRASGKWRILATGRGSAIDPRLSPDGVLVAYVANDDLHVVPIAGGAEHAVTHGGSDAKTHALADFIAAEELDRSRGFWWSPDSRELLYEEADVSGLERFTIADPAHPENPPDRVAYPRAGHANAALALAIAPVTGGASRAVGWDHARFPYLANVTWDAGAPPTITVLDRLQKLEQALAIDRATGKVRVLVEEKDDAWINVDPSVPKWLDDGSAFLWSTERDGAWQLELRGKDGALVRALTSLNGGYKELAHVDSKKRVAYVNAAPDTLHERVVRVSLDDAKNDVVLAREDASIKAQFGDSDDAFVATTLTLGALESMSARAADGKVVRDLPSVVEAPRVPDVTLETVGPDATHVALIRPHAYVAGTRAPLIDYAYGGPHANMVEMGMRGYLIAQWMADATGAIVVSIDARGTPGRGRAWERAIAGKLGEVPLEGHVDAIRAIGAAHPEIDASRVGVFGWSFGGYFSGLAVLRRPDVYGVGVAIAPVTDWRDYDTAYTERYLGLPDTARAAYDDASMLTWAAKPRPAVDSTLFVAHGTADDNVYFLHSLKLADALERAGRPFRFMPLPGQTHMVATPELQEALWTQAAEVLRGGLAGHAR